MRGTKTPQSSMFCLISPESKVPERHPLRQVKKVVDGVLRELSPVFEKMYSAVGRPSIPPESLLKATVLIALYSVRSDRIFLFFVESRSRIAPFQPRRHRPRRSAL